MEAVLANLGCYGRNTGQAHTLPTFRHVLFELVSELQAGDLSGLKYEVKSLTTPGLQSSTGL
jgi:hypothetical protein